MNGDVTSSLPTFITTLLKSWLGGNEVCVVSWFTESHTRQVRPESPGLAGLWAPVSCGCLSLCEMSRVTSAAGPRHGTGELGQDPGTPTSQLWTNRLPHLIGILLIFFKTLSIGH